MLAVRKLSPRRASATSAAQPLPGAHSTGWRVGLPWALAGVALGALVTGSGHAWGQEQGAGSRSSRRTFCSPLPDHCSRYQSNVPVNGRTGCSDRVMILAEAGKGDSVQFFLPMAVGAYAQLGRSMRTRATTSVCCSSRAAQTAALAQADSIARMVPTHSSSISCAPTPTSSRAIPRSSGGRMRTSCATNPPRRPRTSLYADPTPHQPQSARGQRSRPDRKPTSRPVISCLAHQSVIGRRTAPVGGRESTSCKAVDTAMSSAIIRPVGARRAVSRYRARVRCRDRYALLAHVGIASGPPIVREPLDVAELMAVGRPLS